MKRLPKLEVTPAMLVNYSRKRGLRISRAQALSWLDRHREEIECALPECMDHAIDDALAEVCQSEWPEPRYDRMYKMVDSAIEHAVRNYETEHRVELESEVWNCDEMDRVVHSFLRHKGAKRKIASLRAQLAFSRPTPGDHAVTARESSIQLEFNGKDVMATIGGVAATSKRADTKIR